MIKTNFQTKTVTATSIVFNFDDMETLQTMFEGAAIESMDNEDETLLEGIKSIAAKVGIDVDIEMGSAIKVGIDGVKSIAKPGEGESSLDGLTEAELAELGE